MTTSVERESINMTFGHITPLWTITTSIVVFLMQYGFALVEAGFCRQNNVVATYCKNVLDVVFGALSSYFVGYYIAYGEHPSDPQVHVHFFHHLVFQATSATIISGAMAERTTLAAYVVLAVFVSAVPFSIAVRWTWGNGWLNQLDPPFHDFAGSTVVHVVGGVAALIGVACVGPRSGRYGYGQRVSFMPHDVASVLSGVLILWVGWYGFNPGSAGFETEDDIRAASNAAITTTMAAASAAAGSVAFVALQDYLSGQPLHADAVGVGNGVLAGLVSITAGCDVIHTDLSMLVGIGGMASHMVGNMFMEYMQLDDIVGAVAVHGVAGAFGTLAVGLFHPQEGLLVIGKAAMLRSQFIGIISIATFTALTVLPMAMLLNRAGVLRVKPEDEAKGLDCKFGDAASLYITSKNNRLRASYLTLSAYGVAHSELITVLTTLRHATVLPLNAEASKGTIQLQVAAILAELTIPPPPSGTNAKRRKGGKSRRPSTGASPVEHLVFLSHHKAEVGEAAHCFAETAHYLLDAVRGIGGKQLPPELSKSSKFVRRFSLLTKNEPTDVYLQASDMADVRRLLQTVSVSANVVLLLSRTCLEKPHVLCELANAFKEDKTIILVLVEWPGEGDGGAQHRHAFEFPKNLDSSITEWEEVGEFETTKGSNLTKPEDKENALMKVLNSIGSKASEQAGRLRNYMLDKYRRHAHPEDDPTASEFETLKESDDGDGETATETALERSDGGFVNGDELDKEFANEMTDESSTRKSGGRKGNSPRKGASPPKQWTEEGVTEHATDGGTGRLPTPANSPPHTRWACSSFGSSTEAPHRPTARAAWHKAGNAVTTGMLAIGDDYRQTKPSMDEITECTVEAIGSLEDRLYFLEEHLARGIDSVRREIPDGFPELEKFMAELVGLQRLQAATTKQLIEEATTINVRKNVAAVLEGIWNLSTVSGHMEELVKQRVRAEVEAEKEQLRLAWTGSTHPPTKKPPATSSTPSPPPGRKMAGLVPGHNPGKERPGSPTSSKPSKPVPVRRESIMTSVPCCASASSASFDTHSILSKDNASSCSSHSGDRKSRKSTHFRYEA